MAEIPEIRVAYDPGTDEGDYEVMMLLEMWPDGYVVVLERYSQRRDGKGEAKEGT